MNNRKFLEMSPKQRNFILLSIVMCPFITQIDVGMVSLALPTISTEFGITTSAATWISSIYIVFISATVLLFGKLGDSYGHVKVLKYGMVVFTIATFFGGLTSNLTTLLIARIFQALGASAALGNTHGTISRFFPSKERGKAFGINASFVALGTLLGPSVGGVILARYSWNMLFYSKVPVCIMILILQFYWLRDDEGKTGEKIDWRGSCYFFIAIASFFITLQQSQKLGITSPLVFGGFVVAIVFFIAFFMWQKKCKKPLLDLKVFENKLLTTSLYCTVISYSAISAINLILPFYFQNVREMTASESGLILTVYPLVLVFVAPICGRLSDKIGGEILTLYGLMFSLAGLVGMIFVTEFTSYWILIVIIVILGIGSGLFQSPNNLLVMESVPSEKLGIGGSLNALTRNIGNNIGIALTTIILYNGISTAVGYHTTSYVESRPDAFILGMRNTFICMSIISITAILLTMLRCIKKNRV